MTPTRSAELVADVRSEIDRLTVTREQSDLIRETICKDATPNEMKLFFFDCARQGVHPLDKLLIFTKRGGKYTPVTSIDFMRARAAETGEMAGSDDAVFRDAAGERIATVTVYRLTQGQRFAYTGTAHWSEYEPDQDFMWRKMPHVMLAKCAEAVALRKAFPRQLAGMYAQEELDQAISPADVTPPPPKKSTPAIIEAPAPKSQPAAPSVEAVSLAVGAADTPPAGRVYVESVESEATANSSVTVYTLILSTGAEVVTKNSWWATLARQYRDQRTPCRIVSHKTRGGEAEILDDILIGDQTKTPTEGSIPF